MKQWVCWQQLKHHQAEGVSMSLGTAPLCAFAKREWMGSARCSPGYSGISTSLKAGTTGHGMYSLLRRTSYPTQKVSGDNSFMGLFAYLLCFFAVYSTFIHVYSAFATCFASLFYFHSLMMSGGIVAHVARCRRGADLGWPSLASRENMGKTWGKNQISIRFWCDLVASRLKCLSQGERFGRSNVDKHLLPTDIRQVGQVVSFTCPGRWQGQGRKLRES